MFPPEFVTPQTDIELSLSGDMAGGGQSPSGINLRLSLGGDMTGGPAFALVNPAPILDEIEAGAFDNQFYTARLLDETETVIKIENARLEKPKDSGGERVSVSIGRKILSEISVDKTYSFEVGTRETWNGAISWDRIIDNAKLNSRQYAVAKRNGLPADALTIDLIETKKHKINQPALKNYIFYDQTQTKVEISESDKIFDSNGDYVRTQSYAYNSLTYYKLLQFVAQKCGMAGVVTNVPNFQLIRADFSWKKSYRESLNNAGGMYKPLIAITADNKLKVLTKFAPIPDDFDPIEITVAHYTDLQLAITENANVSAVEITYVSSAMQANVTEDIDDPVEIIPQGGQFGDATFSETRVLRTFRYWKHSSNLNVILDKKLVREVHSTYNAENVLTDRETTNYLYDAQAKQTGMTMTIESTVPNLEIDPPVAQLLTTKTVKQASLWATDAKNPKRQFLNKKITQVRGLIAVDAENQALGASGEMEDYRQDFEKVYESGNLTADMTSPFGALETITDTLTPIGNNLYQMRTEIRDEIRGKSKFRNSEPAAGDASIGAVGGKARQFVLWREGESFSDNSGGEIIELLAGELPMDFFLELGNIILTRRMEGFQDGTVTVSGYHKSLDRGVYFTVKDRDGNKLARVLCEGVVTEFSRLSVPYEQTVVSRISISEV